VELQNESHEQFKNALESVEAEASELNSRLILQNQKLWMKTEHVVTHRFKVITFYLKRTIYSN
jgi:hypothetical protein